MTEDELYQLEVKVALARFPFQPAAGWRVTVHVDAMERAQGGRHPRGKAQRARKALRQLRQLGVSIGAHHLFGPVDLVAEGERGALRLVEVEGGRGVKRSKRSIRR